MKRFSVIGTALFLSFLVFSAPRVLAQNAKLLLEVMDPSDVLVVLSPEKGGEPMEVLSDLQKVEGVITNRSWKKDVVEVIIGPKFDSKSDVIPHFEKLLLGQGAERVIFYKAKSNFIVIGEKLPILKDVKKKK